MILKQRLECGKERYHAATGGRVGLANCLFGLSKNNFCSMKCFYKDSCSCDKKED